MTNRNLTASEGRTTTAPVAEPWPPALTALRDWLNKALERHFESSEIPETPHSPLRDAVRYAVLADGKRMRPLIAAETCRMLCGSPDAALSAAMALECVHVFSLVHDDLPAMDDDVLRRGRPTTHVQFGEADAILAGDWLLAEAFKLLAADGRLAAETRVALIATLARATGGMIRGQSADLKGEALPPNEALVRYVHERKTARLLAAASAMGAIAAGAPTEQVARLMSFGRELGIAFQIIDDLLDATGTAEQLGKAANKDAARRKQTYPAAFGLIESRRLAAAHADAALAALAPFGDAGDGLRFLARFVTARTR